MRRSIEDDTESVREGLVRLVAGKWKDEATSEWLKGRAKTEHFVLPALGSLHSEFGRIVFTRDLDGRRPYLDPGTGIPPEHLRRAAANARLAADKIETAVNSLSTYVGWDIRKGW
jgi:hypothetical protein